MSTPHVGRSCSFAAQLFALPSFQCRIEETCCLSLNVSARVYGMLDTGISYPSGGHIVKNMHTLFRQAPSVYVMGSELYPWARYQTPVASLLDAGLLHPATRAIMHDFTIYSANKDAYVNLRLVVEIGLEHGMFIPSKHVRVVWLTNFPESRVVFEVSFYVLLIGLVLEMGHEWATYGTVSLSSRPATQTA